MNKLVDVVKLESVNRGTPDNPLLTVVVTGLESDLKTVVRFEIQRDDAEDFLEHIAYILNHNYEKLPVVEDAVEELEDEFEIGKPEEPKQIGKGDGSATL